MEFEAVIGLEIHVEMKTKSKMFSSSPVTFGEVPNTQCSYGDMAFPGLLPTLNKQGVINGIRFSNALHMSIDKELWFDRKNYFYSDLPRGYQITQDKRPIGSKGYLEVDTVDGKRKINIERLHLEEDTCKQLHSWDCTLLDFNRAGIGLLEIVSAPDMHTSEEAMKYVEKIRSIASFLDVSDGKMEEGSLRCDVNISLREKGTTKFGDRVEIKNINTISNIGAAIDFEIARQSIILLTGGVVTQETRRYDEASKETITMRNKDNDMDYQFYVDPNIMPVILSDEFVEWAIKSSPELAEHKLARYKELGLNDYDSGQLISSKEVSDYFDAASKDCSNVKLLANWVIVDIQAILNKEGISIKEFKVSPTNMSRLINMISSNKCSNKQAREVFLKMLTNDEDPEKIFAASGETLISNEEELLVLIKQVLDVNEDNIKELKEGKTRIFGYLVGQVMKLSKGKANPSMTSKLLQKEIDKR